MKHSLLLTALLLAAPITHAANQSEIAMQFGMTEAATNVVQEVQTNTVRGLFYTRWLIETNTTPTRQTGIGIHNWLLATNIYVTSLVNCATNHIYGMWHIDDYVPPCEKEHFDTTPQADITYVQSNLVATLVWRNQTNEWCLESIPVREIKRVWRWEKVKKYEEGK